MKSTVIILLITVGFLQSACNPPLLNVSAEENSSSSTSDESADSKSTSIDGLNLVKAYGCPNAFDDIDLCFKIQWIDNDGNNVAAPIYYESFREKQMMARIYFWTKSDGWPVDPRTEFSEVKFIKVKPFMPTMGHGTMKFYSQVTEVKGRIGQFDVTNIRFIMNGDDEDPWDFRIQLKTDHDDKDFHNSENPASEANVWKQKILQFNKLERR